MLVERDVTPQVEDEDGVRALRFNNGVLQSAMQVNDPYALELGYTRAMMAFLLFRGDPRDILIVGLGGGSLSKFCHRQLPAARVTTVEINPAVIALRDQFAIPPDDERFRIVEADAAEYLARPTTTADVILLDGYDEHGLPETLASADFYSRCRDLVDPDGILSVNLWGGDPHRDIHLGRLREVFEDRVWWCEPPASSSLVVLCHASPDFKPSWSQIAEAARAVDRRLLLGLAWLVDDLRDRHDPETG